MSSDGGEPRRGYNLPRRYPVQTPAEPDAAPPGAAATSGEVTRQNPTLAEAAQQYRQSTPGGPGAASPQPYPQDRGPGGHPLPTAPAPPHPSTGGPGQRPGRSGGLSTRALVLIVAGVAVIALVVGLIIGLSGGDDSPKLNGQPPPPATGTPSRLTTTTASSALPSPAPASSTAGGVPPSATQLCTTLGNTAPLTSYVALPRPAERMPTTYVEPRAGVKVAVCVGFFRPGAGTARGRVAYLAKYERLAATEYALTLKTRGWTLAPTLPRVTYRDNLGTTVTLVQQGTSLVTVVGTGR